MSNHIHHSGNLSQQEGIRLASSKDKWQPNLSFPLPLKNNVIDSISYTITSNELT